MELKLDPGKVDGLVPAEQAVIRELLKVYNSHKANNAQKDKFYEGRVSLGSVNLGLALPKGIEGLEIGCAWGAKCVDVLAAHSMFDGFVGSNGEDVPEIDKIVEGNRLIAAYMVAARDELKYGCTFATLSADETLGCKIRFHSPQTASAIWDGERGRIACGMAIIDTVPDNESGDTWSPSLINVYLDYAVIVLKRGENAWKADRLPNPMGRPLMEPLIWNATSNKPFGRSRLKAPIRNLIKDYVRTLANATIALEFATAPQKYVLGVTDKQYDAITQQKFNQYVGSILAATANPDTGEKPTFGQLTQGSLAPHVEKLRMIATQFSAATGLTVADVGVVNDANPTSSDAILAQSRTLVAMAEQLNVGNGDALRTIALMALAIAGNTTVEKLDDAQKAIVAHFKNPAMPSVAVTADAAIKIATARQDFAGTDTFLEMIGFDKADIRRIKAQERLERGMQTLLGEFA